MRLNTFLTVVASLCFLVPTSPTRADLILEITDLDTLDSVTITDNMAGDDNPLVGQIGYGAASTIGNFTIFGGTSVVSKPFLSNGPSAAYFDLHLDVFNETVSDSGLARLQVRITDTGFTLADTMSSWTLTSSIGGLTDGTVEYVESYDPDNSEFGVMDPSNDTSNDFGALMGGGIFDPTFSASLATGIANVANPFSLTEVLTITHSDIFQFTTFDSDSLVTPDPVPEPASCIAWFIGAAALYSMRRRKPG
jgi:hypothetical protein